MVSRVRNAAGLALLLALMSSLAASAKGQFSFIAITGHGLDGEVRTTDPNLTTEFFAFADFYRDKIEAPADPGLGYQITRYYIDGQREIAFDRLQYYPAAGFVFYDGILNGDSEYDGEWYSANPAMRTIFEKVVLAATSAQAQPEKTVKEVAPVAPPVQQEETAPSMDTSRTVVSIAVLAGGLVILLWAARLRKPALR